MTDAPDKALPPCPFCGCEAVHILHQPHTHSPLLKRALPWLPDADEQHEIACARCQTGFLRATPDEAIAAWSLRAGQAEAEARVKAAEGVADGVHEALWAADARVKALEAALQQISDLFGDAVQADCENGVRWLNERAAANYLKDAPETLAAIRKTQDIIATALESHPHD